MQGYWQEHAKCRGMNIDLFFLELGQTGPDAKKTKEVCAQCPVSRQCLDYAIDNKIQHGIYGGFSPKDRRAIRRARLINQ